MHPIDLHQHTAAPVPRDHKKILSPQTIAVIGASQDPSKIGSRILTNITEGGFTGQVYPVNLTAKTIQGYRTYPSVADIPTTVDHAVVAIPAKGVPAVLDQCGKKGISEVTVISAGFKESGQEGEQLERELATIAHTYSISLFGPNCLGFINMEHSLNATFSAASAKPGNLILFSQSGAFGTAILDWAQNVNLGIRYFVSLGNKAVIDETDLLARWLEEYADNTENLIFAGYLEDIRQGRTFMRIASQLACRHPVIILKSGKGSASQQAISSHTGALTTEDRVVETALKQSNCLRVNDIQQLFDTILILSRQSVPAGNHVAIITNAGGPGVVTTDLIEESSLTMANFSETTRYSLQHSLPPEANTSNPIDVLGDADASRFKRSLELALMDENVDSAIVILTPQAVTQIEATAGVISEVYKRYPFKPVITTFVGGTAVKQSVDMLNRYHMPIYPYPGQAVSALEFAFRYRSVQDLQTFDDGSAIPQTSDTLSDPSGCIIGKRADDFVQQYHIPIPQTHYLDPGQTPDETFLNTITFPVIAKLVSPLILHKTELSAVSRDIHTDEDLITAITNLNTIWQRSFPNSYSYSVQIQECISDGDEVIIGFSRDPSFGPVLTFGAGGILAELIDDVSQRIAPITAEDAHVMITETKLSPLLTGYRGKTRRDVHSISIILEKVSRMALEHPEIKEFDINPYFVLNEGLGGRAVDITILLA